MATKMVLSPQELEEFKRDMDDLRVRRNEDLGWARHQSQFSRVSFVVNFRGRHFFVFYLGASSSLL